MPNKTSHDDDHLDFAKIEKEVHNAVAYDEKYWRENSAKIRAVEQRVPTYDDFREMVMAAHLRPLEKGDRISDIGRFTQVWNQLAFDPISADSTQNGTTSTELDVNGLCMPKSGQEFSRTWKHLNKNTEDQKNYLLIVGPERLGTLFKTEITGGLLGEFLHCLNSVPVKESEADIVVELLEAFTKTQRFSLTLAFLSKGEKESGVAVFQRLKEIGGNGAGQSKTPEVEELEKKYKFS